jgi:hypothetical protein
MFKEQDATNLRNLLQNNLASYAQDAVDNGAAPNTAGIQKVLEIQRDWILNQNVGMSENFDYSYGTSSHDRNLSDTCFSTMLTSDNTLGMSPRSSHTRRINHHPEYYPHHWDLP